MNDSINNGVWPVMITPFTDDNRIDYANLLRLIEWYAGQGVSGLFAVCQSSEMFLLSRQERFELARFVVSNVPSGMGVVASGHVAEALAEQVDEAKRMLDTGIDAYVFISNQFAAPDEGEEEAKRTIERLITAIPSDHFGIYECPAPYKRLLSPELLRWCADTGRFSFLKDTCCDVTQLRAKIESVKGTPLKVFNANAATLLASLRMGAAGYSGVMASFHASLYVWLCREYAQNPAMAEQLQDILGAASVMECQIYPINAKYHMQLEGIPMTLHSRIRDMTQLTGSRKLEVEQFRRAMNRLHGSLLST